jgi:hypothetical protein
MNDDLIMEEEHLEMMEENLEMMKDFWLLQHQ